MQIRTIQRDSKHSNGNLNHSKGIRSLRMEIRTIRKGFEAFESKFESFERDSNHSNPNSNHSKGIRSILRANPNPKPNPELIRLDG